LGSVITGAAFCPHPPLLVPEIAQGAAAELDDLRAACRTAIRRVAAPGTAVIVLGAGPAWMPYEATVRGSLAGYGVDLELPLGSEAPGPVALPLPLTIGAWLLRDALGPESGATGWAVGPDDGELVIDDDVALLVMADGSARRSPAAPGYLDERAKGFDAGVAAALGAGDPAGLRVDVELADVLLAAGGRTWNAAAELLGNRTWAAELLYDAAPYGVAYFVAAWTAGD
jgi:hypothetical protein